MLHKCHYYSWVRLFVFSGELTNVKFFQACVSVEATAFANSFSQNFEYNERANSRHITKHFKGFSHNENEN